MRRSVAVLFVLLLGGGLLSFGLMNPGAPKTHLGVTLIGVGTISGTASDRSGLKGLTADGKTRNNRLGGLGSAIAYLGSGDEYLLVSDSGPKGAGYVCRFHRLRIQVVPNARKPVKLELVGTTLLTHEDGTPFTGAFNGAKPEYLLDPEGLRVGRGGEIFVSDEYGPGAYQFDASGRRVKSFAVPEYFRSGRQENRGMEGLALAPDGTKLYAAMQSPLVRDGGRAGANCRILEIDVATGRALREFVYQLDDPANSACEILAVNATTFLVLERDGKAAFKKVFRIDLADATEVSGMPVLPAAVVPVKKTLFLDLLAKPYGIVGPNCPEKFEGLALGPDLPDGRHLLLVTADNDFAPDQPFRVYAFAIDGARLPDFWPQQFDPK